MSQSLDFRAHLQRSTGRTSLARANALLFVILGCILLGLLWAALAEVDEVTRGEGRVIPSTQTQVVQHFEGGIVQSILVREGQIVEQGEALLVLSQSLLRGEFGQEQAEYLSLLAKVARLTAEVEEREPDFSADLRQRVPNTVAAEWQLYLGRQQELQSEVRVLERQLHQRERELREAEANLRTAERGVALIRQEIGIIEPLVSRGLEPEISLLALRRSLNDLSGAAEAAELTIDRLRSAIEEMEDRGHALVDAFRAQALSELAEATARLSARAEFLPALEDRVERLELRSPVRGIVNRLHVATVGGVAPAGQPLVEVVPLDDQLLVEAFIRPQDIAFLHPGLPVKIKITAYDFSRYGSIDGTLETISADAIELPDDGGTAYVAQVRADGVLTDAEGAPLSIIPGMVAEVDILTGRRTVLDYLIRPVVRVKETAFRD